jgi:WD40 repeat protein
MKKILYTLLSAGVLLLANLFVANGTFQVAVESPTPNPSPTLEPLLETEPAPEDGPTPVSVATSEPGDPYGELYFTVIQPKMYSPPATPPPGVNEATYSLVRLPGSCVVGLIECPSPEEVPTPFNMRDVLALGFDSGSLIWSPDGRQALLTIHPPDDFTEGWTAEEWEQFKTSKLEDLTISASTLYLFDAETDTWRELYRADRKLFYAAHWSPDGQWIAFVVSASMLSFHPFQAEDGVYVVHPDGSGLQRLGGLSDYGTILGWIGNNILLQRQLHPGSTTDFTHVVEKLNFDGQVTTLFESSRLVNYALAPDGGSLLAADSITRNGGGPQRAVDVLALDGSVIHSFGTFDNPSSAIYPFVWSPDGTQVAFGNLRRLYVAPRIGQSSLPADTYGIAPDTRQVYVADDTYTTPNYMDIQFSRDGRYLLMGVYEGYMHFVVVSLETGQSTPLVIPHLDPFVWDENYLGDPSFFSWR